jgi:S1-C subfamily serine protease
MFAVIAAGIYGASSAQCDESILPEVVQSIKKATVFVKIKGEGIEGSGSGFVVKVDGRTTYIVTNNHVVEPEVLELVEKLVVVPTAPGSPYASRHHGSRGYPFPGIPTPPGFPNPQQSQPRGVTIQRRAEIVKQKLKNVDFTAVFRSGTPDEQSIRAEIVGTDTDNDLAVIKVVDVTDPPTPISIVPDALPTETQTVYSFGFPLGQTLSIGHGNPAMTIGKASISSLRMDDEGELALLQVDGAINHGNSGGPFVDTKGRLVGVAVAFMKDSTNIGLIIPAQYVDALIYGHLDTPQMQLTRVPGGELQLTVQSAMLDPLRNLKSAKVRYVAADKVAQKPKATDHLGDLSKCHEISLDFQDRQASKQIALKKEINNLSIYCQADGVDSQGGHHYSKIVALQLQAPPPGSYASAAGQPLSNVASNAARSNPSMPNSAQNSSPNSLKVNPFAPSEAANSATQALPVVPVNDDPAPRYGTTDSFKSADDYNTVLEDLNSGSFTRRIHAVMRLASVPPTEAHADVAKALESVVVSEKNPAIRINAAAALAVWGTPDNLPALERVVSYDTDKLLRSRVKLSMDAIKERNQ